MKDTIIELLESIKTGVDYASCGALVDDGVLTSFEIMRLVSLLADEFDVEITAAELIPENFNSVEAMQAMIEELQ